MTTPSWAQAAMNGASRAVSAWDVHVALNAPGWWDELAARDAEGVPRIAGPFVRPSITEGSVDWDGLMLTPRWLGEDSSQAVAALQPSLNAGQGADEWQRLRAGAAARSEVVLAIPMFGTVEPPRNPNPFGSEQSLSLPGSAANGSDYVSGRRISLATKPTIFDQLGGADRDLASRVVTVRDLELPWWSLHHTGSIIDPGVIGVAKVVGESRLAGGRSHLVGVCMVLSWQGSSATPRAAKGNLPEDFET
jgi:hypothetical protein